MKLFLKRMGFILLVFTSASLIISFSSLWALRQGSFYKPSFLINNVEAAEFDYIVLGASTGLTTLNTQVIDSVIGTRGLNLAMDDTALSSQYVMLQHFIATGKTTKICVLAPSVSSYDAPSNRLSDNDYRFLPYVNRDYVSDYYRSFTGETARLLSTSKWLPLLGVGYYNAELFYPSLLSLYDSKKRNRFDSQGNYTYPVRSRDSKVISNRAPIAVHFTNSYLQKIKALCDAQGIRLVCYFSPLENKKAIVGTSEYTVINQTDLLDNTRYFYDAIHVNSIGRQVVSIRFAEELGVFLR